MDLLSYHDGNPGNLVLPLGDQAKESLKVTLQEEGIL